MTSPQMQAPPLPDRKPSDEEMDIYGLTDPGKVRTENQDQFLVSSLRKEACWSAAPIMEVVETAVSKDIAHSLPSLPAQSVDRCSRSPSTA